MPKKAIQKDILVDPWRASAYIGEDLREECDNLARSHKPLPGRASWPGRDDDGGEDDGDDDVDNDGEDDGEDDGDEKEEGESTTAQCNHKWQLGVPKLFLLWSP